MEGGEKIVQIITKRWKENRGTRGRNTVGHKFHAFCQFAEAQLSTALEIPCCGLRSLARYSSKNRGTLPEDSQLPSHSITALARFLSGVSVIVVSTKATHRKIRSPLCAHKTAYEEETQTLSPPQQQRFRGRDGALPRTTDTTQIRYSITPRRRSR